MDDEGWWMKMEMNDEVELCVKYMGFVVNQFIFLVKKKRRRMVVNKFNFDWDLDDDMS